MFLVCGLIDLVQGLLLLGGVGLMNVWWWLFVLVVVLSWSWVALRILGLGLF